MYIAYVVVATTDIDYVVVARTSTRWSLPSIQFSCREDFCERLTALLSETTPVTLVHCAPLPTPDVLVGSFSEEPWYCAAVMRVDVARSHTLVVPIQSILSEGILSVQEELAVRTASARLRMPIAAFDSHSAIHDAILWAEQTIHARLGVRVISSTRLRCTRLDVVIRFQTEAGNVYLKAGLHRVADEAALTALLHILRPRQFANTLAVDHLHERWLYEELRGVPLSAVPLTRRNIVRAVRALASLQKEAINAEGVRNHLSHRTLTALALFHNVDRIVETVLQADLVDSDAPLESAWQMMKEGISRECAVVDQLEQTLSLVLSDFWSDNILVTSDGIGFIDIGNSFWSYPFLPLWRFIRDVERQLPQAGWVRRVTEVAFADEWSDLVPRRNTVHMTRYLWLLGRLFGILMTSCDLDRYEQALGLTSHTRYRALRLAPRIRDLLMAFSLRAFRSDSTLLGQSMLRRTRFWLS